MTLITNESATGQSGGEGQQNQGAGNSGAAAASTGGQARWQDSLPDDLKQNATLNLFNKVEDLAKAHVHAQSLLGKKGIFPPGENAPKEEWQSFFKQVGLPEKDKYAVKVPEGKKFDEKILGKLKDIAYENGVMPKALESIVEAIITEGESAGNAMREQTRIQYEEGIAALKKEWGNAFDREVNAARAAVKEMGPDFQKYLQDTGLGNDPMMIKAMAKFGKQYMKEDQLRGEGKGAFTMSPAEIDAELSKIMGDPAYADAAHPSHKSVVGKAEQLFKLKFGA